MVRINIIVISIRQFSVETQCIASLQRNRKRTYKCVMEYRKKSFRIPSARLPFWDYSKNAAYFVTICTKNHKSYFGKISDTKMVSSEIGGIVEIEWLKTPEIRPDMNLELGEFIVMPNHFHGIVIIGQNKYNSDFNSTVQCRDAMHCVSTDNDKPLNKFGPQSKNLASIIRGFKSSVTKKARLINSDFAWQSRYYEHIIKNEKSFQKISEYILYNPLTWKEDTCNMENNRPY